MTLLSVPDMSCGHCKASVTQALTALGTAGTISFDMTARQVQVDGPAAPDALLAALNEIGFPAQVIPSK
jgi:copper chaperone